MLDSNWDDLRPAFTAILDDLDGNRDQWEEAAARNELPLECQVAECMARKVSEVSDKLPIQLSTSEIADAMEGLLWDFLQHRQLYTERASTRGLQLNEYLFEALVKSIADYVDFVKEWDAESARLAFRAKQSWLIRFFAPILRFSLSIRTRKRLKDDSNLPF